MARHAGFAAAATLTQGLANDIASSYVTYGVGPLFFPLPQTVSVGSTTVTFAGLIQLLAPTLEFHANPGNAVTVHFSFLSTFRAQVNGQPMQSWVVRWDATVSVPLLTTIQGTQIVLGINAAQVVLLPLTLTQQQGPAIPPEILSALQSTQLAAAITAAVNQLPPITVSPPMLNTQINYVQPLDIKETKVSLFDWFTINLTVSNIVLRVLEGAVTVAVDFAGYTSGDPNQLVDLTEVGGNGSTYVQTVTESTDLSDTAILVKLAEQPGGSLALVFNMNVVTQVVERQVSPQVRGTPVAKQVVLQSVAANYSVFNKPLRGPEDGLALSFMAASMGVDASGVAYIQPFLRTYDGPTNFIQDDTWHFSVGDVEIGIPIWAELLIGIAQVLTLIGGLVGVFVAAMNIRGLLPFFDDLITSINDAFAKADPGNIGSNVQGKLQSGAFGGALPPPWIQPMPGLTAPRFDGMIKNISVTFDTIDIAINTWIDWDDRTPPPIGVITPQSVGAWQIEPFAISLKLRSDYEKLGGSAILVRWDVRRSDTNQSVASVVKAYNDPSGNGPVIVHHSEELYLVNAFNVTCTATLTLGSQVGEIFSASQTIVINDALDRRRKFAHWGPHVVHIMNKGTDNQWWTHIRRSKIHRTAVRARCRELKRRLAYRGIVTYQDGLPFPWDQLNENRGPLCEYCFFGGPDKTIAFPEEDWF